MTLEKERRSVGVFAKRSDAELALQELKVSNFPMRKVSVIARNAEEQEDIAGVEVKEHSGNTSKEGAAAGAITGTALGSLTGLLVGMGLLALPGIGPIMLAGAEATTIASTLLGGAIGAATGSLAGALLGLGIPEQKARVYSDLVSQGYYLVIVTGTEEVVHFAKQILSNRGIQEWGVYETPISLNNRYKYGVGVFSTLQDAKIALSMLRAAGFPMSRVSVIGKNTITLLEGFTEFQNSYAAFTVPDDLVKEYESQVSVDNYLLVINATDIYMAGAKAILESNKVQSFRIYSQSTLLST
ncbi:MAG: DUF1269 domain-containing protein [Desmonostoc vinosum HA7617-LM4]|jgi:uncharacterized membrane protein|nr:DUF1269 domain-containing protein [Desmonostoc vinosum HA7617-LM4]